MGKSLYPDWTHEPPADACVHCAHPIPAGTTDCQWCGFPELSAAKERTRNAVEMHTAAERIGMSTRRLLKQLDKVKEICNG